MSKKNLLNEATVRRFMQLADLKPITEEFLPETEEVVEEEVVEEEKAEEITEEGAEEKLEEKEDLEEAHCGNRDEEELEEMAHPAKADEEAEEAEELAPEAEMVSLEDLKRGLEALVAAVPGLDLEVEGDEEEPAEEAPEMDMEVDMEMDEEPAEDMEDEEPAGRDHYMEENETLAEEITKKVMERIAQEQNKQEIDVDVLAERIMKRLSEKKK